MRLQLSRRSWRGSVGSGEVGGGDSGVALGRGVSAVWVVYAAREWRGVVVGRGQVREWGGRRVG